MIADIISKVKNGYQDHKDDLFIAAVIFLVGMASFGLGRLSAIWTEKEPVTITSSNESRISNLGDNEVQKIGTNSQNSKFDIPNSKGKYVASKSGTAYHYPWCAGAQKIKETNKIWFQTKEDAEKAGYKPAGNCDGL